MGRVIARVKLCDPHSPSKFIDVELLVDTGSTCTWIKRRRLEEIGIRPMDRRRFRTIDNRIVKREVGEAVVECLGRRVVTIAVFAE